MNAKITAMPRRHVIGCGILALTRAAWAEPPAGFEPLPAQVTITESQLTTAVLIDGKGPFQFIVDTGADRSVIAEDVAKALHLPIGRTVIVQGIIRAIPAPTVPVAELRFGSEVRNDLEVPVLPRALLKADGFLGLDAIGKNRVVFDFRKRTLRVAGPQPDFFLMHRGNRESYIGAPGDAGHLRSSACHIDGVLASAFIDTGAEVSVGNEALRRALMATGRSFGRERDIVLTGITGGSCPGKVLRLKAIGLGDLEFTGCEIAVADLDVFKIWDLADRPALLIGLNFLRQFQIVTIDYHRQEFRLKLASSSWVNKKPA